MAKLPLKTILDGNAIFEEFKGALTENFVLQQLILNEENDIFYWTNDNSTAEVDFVIQNEEKIIPIEVKANKSTNNTSLTRYNEKFDNDISIRFSMNNLIKDGKIINIPLFLIEYMENFIQF